MRILSTHLIVIMSILSCSVRADDPVALEFRDDFDGKYDDEWTIINENARNISLTKNSGMLTITAERGGIWGGATSARNIFLIDTPMRSGNFVMTTRIVGFDPKQNYEQAGLICFNDVDNYVKFDLEFDSTNGGRTLAVVPEIDGQDLDDTTLKVKHAEPEMWLRLVLYHDKYIFSASRDGKKFRTISRQTIELDYPAMVGIITQSRVGGGPPDVEVQFDLFEIAPLESKPELIELIEAEMTF